MKRNAYILFFTAFLWGQELLAQDQINWDFSYNKETKNVEMTANLSPGWHIYSTNLGAIAGPIPTEFTFYPNKQVAIRDKVIEPLAKEEYDPNFEETVKYFEKQVVFKQAIRWKGKPTILKGSVVYMICNDRMCLPPVEKNIEVTIQ